MGMPEIDNRISIGNILVVGGMVAAFATAWGSLDGRAKDTAAEAAVNAAQISSNEKRIRALENNAARQDERMILILESLRKIEDRLERGYKTP